MTGWYVERSLSSGVCSFGFPRDIVSHFHHSLKVHELHLVSITCFDFLGKVRNCNSQKTKKGLEESVYARVTFVALTTSNCHFFLCFFFFNF